MEAVEGAVPALLGSGAFFPPSSSPYILIPAIITRFKEVLLASSMLPTAGSPFSGIGAGESPPSMDGESALEVRSKEDRLWVIERAVVVIVLVEEDAVGVRREGRVPVVAERARGFLRAGACADDFSGS